MIFFYTFVFVLTKIYSLKSTLYRIFHEYILIVYILIKKYSLQKVDAKKLEKAEAKLQQKQEKRSNNELSGRINITSQGIESASASQMTSKKDSRMETKGNVNKIQDIRIENFDIAYGDRILLQGADLTLAFGRRYGLIGRNGLGKTTLLRMISR